MQSAETTAFSDDDFGLSNSTSGVSVSSEPIVLRDRKLNAGINHGTWPTAQNMWNSEPTTGDLSVATTTPLSLQKYDMVTNHIL